MLSVYIFSDKKTVGQQDKFGLLFAGTAAEAVAYIGQFPDRYPGEYSVKALPLDSKDIAATVFLRTRVADPETPVADFSPSDSDDENDNQDFDIVPQDSHE